MRYLIVIAFFFSASVSNAQSQKKLNSKLRMELQLEEDKSDSLYTIYSAAWSEVVEARTKMMNYTIPYLSRTAELCEIERKEVERKMANLKLLDSNVDSIVKPGTLKYLELKSYKHIQEFYYEKENSFFLSPSEGFFDDPENLREENEMLKEKITRYRLEFPRNVEKTKSIQEYTAKVKEYEKELLVLEKSYDQILNVLRFFNGNLTSELYSFERKYRESGPKGFPEIYAKIFPDAFKPKPVMVTNQEADIVVEEMPREIKPEKVSVSQEKIYDLVDEDAEFPGGQAAMAEYIKKNMPYPIHYEGVSGRIYLKFVVYSDGRIGNVVAIKGFEDCEECRQEFIKAIESMPTWKPGKVDGKPVNQWYNLPIRIHPN